NPDFYEDIRGDLDELHDHALTTQGRRSADWQFAKEVLLLFRPSIIRKFTLFNIQHTVAMIKNYFKIGLRNLAKHRSNTVIHILGLAIGLAAFLLINEYVRFERNYDRHFSQADRIYRVSTDSYYNDQLEVQDAMTYAPGPKTLEEQLPEVIGSTITLQNLGTNFMKGDQPIKENIVFADSNFLNIFDYPILEGNPDEMLVEPRTIVLTESYAMKYFGQRDVVGRSMQISNYGEPLKPLKVVGVIADPPEQTHYKFDILMAASTLRKRMEKEAWNGNNYYGYILLEENTDVEHLKSKLHELSLQFMDEDGEDRFSIMPITDIHLESTMTYEPEPTGSLRAVRFLNLISIFILLIAWINYINLSTARAVERAREVGMRKVVGATKLQLVGQFFTEALLVNFMAVLIACLVAQASLPLFNQLVGKTILETTWNSPGFLGNLLLFFLLGTLVTGIYPALVLSAFRPIGVLKGAFSRTKHGSLLRKSLV
ncbi:MAG: ABC transporter permease, partial [Bacteroidota bacterium]